MLEKLPTRPFDNQTSLSISHELQSFYEKRRSVRSFKKSQINPEIIYNAIKIASSAPSGANKQPWNFILIEDPLTKRHIRFEAELRETEFYQQKKPQKMLQDIKQLHTNEEKSFLEKANFLLPIFSKSYELDENNQKKSNYYVKESVGIATGMMISSLHLSGLSVLTYTPTKMQFLTQLLGRPENEKLFILLAIGLPHDQTQVPVIQKKTLKQISSTFTYPPNKQVITKALQ